MTHRRMIGAVLACAVAMTAVATSMAYGQERAITMRGGERIADLLRPGDSRVLVTDVEPAPHLVPPRSGVSWLEWRTQLSDLIVVARLAGQRSFLSADGRQVRTVLTLRVTDILKAPASGAITVGSSFSWETFGGTVTIGQVRVRERKGWSRAFREGADYLIFIRVSPPDDPLGGGRLVFDETSMFEVTGDGLTNMVLDRIEESLSDQSLSNVATKIRAFKPQK